MATLSVDPNKTIAEDKACQTVIHVSPFILDECYNFGLVSSFKSCQTALNFDKDEDIQNFISALKYVPYNSITEDCIKVIDLPRKVHLQFPREIDKHSPIFFAAKALTLSDDDFMSEFCMDLIRCRDYPSAKRKRVDANVQTDYMDENVEHCPAAELCVTVTSNEQAEEIRQDQSIEEVKQVEGVKVAQQLEQVEQTEPTEQPEPIEQNEEIVEVKNFEKLEAVRLGHKSCKAAHRCSKISDDIFKPQSSQGNQISGNNELLQETKDLKSDQQIQNSNNTELFENTQDNIEEKPNSNENTRDENLQGTQENIEADQQLLHPSSEK